MLSSVLRSQTAFGVNVKIMRVFTAIPQLVNNNAQIIQNVVIIIKRNISNLSQNNS